jgi:hypothetical protein
MKYKLYDKVCSIRLGNPFIGQIVGICDAKLYAQRDLIPLGYARISENYIQFLHSHPWFKLKEDWPADPVYYIKLDRRDKSISYSEYCEANELDLNLTSEKIYANLPDVNLVAHPEFDLTLL